MLAQGILPSVPSFLVITKTIDCVLLSIPTCFAVPILFAFSSITVLPSIELTDAAELGVVASTVGVVASTVGVTAFGSNGFALPTSPSSLGLLNSLYSAIDALHELQMYWPLSAKTKFSATSSLGFSNSIFGGP